MTTFTLGEITQIIGAKSNRVAQVWAEAGVIQADPSTDRAGTGRHRQFSRDEAVIACFLRALASRQIAIGVLKAVSEKLRAHLATPRGRRNIEVAINGDFILDQVYLLLLLSDVPNVRDGSIVFRCETHHSRDAQEDGESFNAFLGRRVTEVLKIAPDALTITINATASLQGLRGK